MSAPVRLASGKAHTIDCRRDMMLRFHIDLIRNEGMGPRSSVAANFSGCRAGGRRASSHDRKAYKTVFLAHDQDEALKPSDWLAELRRGALEMVATPDAIPDEHTTPFIHGCSASGIWIAAIGCVLATRSPLGRRRPPLRSVSRRLAGSGHSNCLLGRMKAGLQPGRATRRFIPRGKKGQNIWARMFSGIGSSTPNACGALGGTWKVPNRTSQIANMSP